MDGGHRDFGELILSIKRKGLALADGHVSNRLMPLAGKDIDLIRIRCREINKQQLHLIRLLRISGALRRYLRTDARPTHPPRIQFTQNGGTLLNIWGST